jgi:NADH-quinone oxidoreductase subunit A
MALSLYQFQYMVYFGVCFIFSIALPTVCIVISEIRKNIKLNEKFSSYECGFEPFDDTRNTFEVHYFVVAILFVIFDLEIIFMFP